ncbi:hypothetical protein AYL99_04234 [Fonsecaea erecta]|uniref:Uncharacterized protein n=1 Tax=Fonsecaea erecta TaxID=1367422 RepID=A0A178ZRE6_9EURO|nr:hypothetical protein AYL99_04234 [Fonsecaea erecta]OAP62031.1 hypothetical protein AYL99_04234 [Fonsecaea erecta]
MKQYGSNMLSKYDRLFSFATFDVLFLHEAKSKSELDIMRTLILGPVNQSSKRERELQNAAARSHAAKASYAHPRKHHKVVTGQYDARDGANEDVGVWGSKVFTGIDPTLTTSIYPGFGSFRSELLNLLPPDAQAGDFQALDFFVEVTLPGIDVANEIFNNSGAFHFLLPTLVSYQLYLFLWSSLHD